MATFDSFKPVQANISGVEYVNTIKHIVVKENDIRIDLYDLYQRKEINEISDEFPDEGRRVRQKRWFLFYEIELENNLHHV